MATENVIIRMTGRALQDMSAVADLGRVVGRSPGADGVQFITDPNSARLSLGILETNAKSLGMVSFVIFGVARVHASALCSAGYALTVGVSGGVTPITGNTSAYYQFGQMVSALGAGQPMSNVKSDAMGTAFVDFLTPTISPCSTTGAFAINIV